jgi:hypothetical protein
MKCTRLARTSITNYNELKDIVTLIEEVNMEREEERKTK